MTCKYCESREGKAGGRYSLSCIECCATLVLSSKPNKQQASAMLEVINRFKDNPGRDAVLEKVKAKL